MWHFNGDKEVKSNMDFTHNSDLDIDNIDLHFRMNMLGLRDAVVWRTAVSHG